MIPKISAVINTLNEERNLEYALRSIASWVDEIVVVDMYSEDATVEIARKYGARVFFHERLSFADPARAFALQQCTGDWVMMLDADELVPLRLRNRLLHIAEHDLADIVNIPWLNFLIGEPLLHTGWGPDQDKHPRFFRKDSLEATAAIHNFLQPRPGSRFLDLPYEEGIAVYHFNYINFEHFVAKMNRYTNIEAEQAHARQAPYSVGRAVARASLELVNRYVRRSGYKDGWRGVYLSLLMAFYRLLSAAKLHERYVIGNADSVRTRYQAYAEQVLLEYELSGPRT